MERIAFLISKLKEQYEQKTDTAQMLMTLRLIETELSGQSQSKQQTLGTSKVSVVMPRSIAVSLPHNHASLPQNNPVKEEEEVIEKPKEYAEKPQVIQREPETAPVEANSVYSKYQPAPEPLPVAAPAFDPILEIPTLSQQKTVKEINDAIEHRQHPSLNERLKQSKIELAEVLKEAPVRDLRKAIGINDRFVFISELFRGDEAMYERSIKTINSFNIYPEAEYWINRELKTKIGWDDSKNIVQHFYQLVKRRFS